MSSEWPLVDVEDCASKEPYSTQIGPFGDLIKAEKYKPFGIPVLRGTNVRSGRFNDEDFVFISNEDAEELKIYECRPDDIVLVHKGTIGRVGIIPHNTKYDKYIIGNSMMKVRCDTARVLPLFLYYWLSSAEAQNYFYGRISQVGVPQLQQPLTTLRQASFRCPPIEIQKKIVSILGSLDDKIELNCRMNTTLESMARAIFKSWFIDFDPVRAKAEGKQSFGMDEETAALFPTEFEDSERGEIPKGWKISSVSEEFNLTMGQSPPGSTYNDDRNGIAFFQGRTDFGFRYPEPRVYCTAPARFAEKGDTLVSVRAPVGDVNMAKDRCCIGRGLAALSHKSSRPSFTYYSMIFLHDDFSNFESEGTVFGCINKEGFRSLKIIAPPKEVVDKYESLIHPLDILIEVNEDQAKTLSQLRDIILPKLLSGELHVSDSQVSNLQARMSVSTPTE